MDKYLVSLSGSNINSHFFKVQVKENAYDSFPSLKKLKKGNYKDLTSKLNCLLNFYSNYNGTIYDYNEVCAGVGFSFSLFNHLNPHFKGRLQLNDISSTCIDNLVVNTKRVKNANITCLDYNSLLCYNIFKYTDFVFADFSNFTLNRTEYSIFYKLLKISHKILVTDVFAFSLKPFNLDKYTIYLNRFNELLKQYNKSITKVFLYSSKTVAILFIETYYNGIEDFSIFEEKPFCTIKKQKQDLLQTI